MLARTCTPTLMQVVATASTFSGVYVPLTILVVTCWVLGSLPLNSPDLHTCTASRDAGRGLGGDAHANRSDQGLDESAPVLRIPEHSP